MGFETVGPHVPEAGDNGQTSSGSSIKNIVPFRAISHPVIHSSLFLVVYKCIHFH